MKTRRRSKYIPHVRKDNTEVLYREKQDIYGDLSFVDPMLMKNTFSYAFKVVQWKGKNGSGSLQWNSGIFREQ